MTPKIAIICFPNTRSSYVMEVFDKAGFELGEVDRRICEGYPSGRLEPLPLAYATSGKGKTKPIDKDTEAGDLSKVQVAKCLPAWIPVLKKHGFNYWVSVCRGGTVCNATEYPHDEVLDSNREFDPHEIWERARAHLERSSGGHTKKKGRPRGSRKNQGENNTSPEHSGPGKEADRRTDSSPTERGRGGDSTEAVKVYAPGSGFPSHWGPNGSN